MTGVARHHSEATIVLWDAISDAERDRDEALESVLKTFDARVEVAVGDYNKAVAAGYEAR